jgi:hypothetical protein
MLFFVAQVWYQNVTATPRGSSSLPALSATVVWFSFGSLSLFKFKYLVHLLSEDRFYLKEAVSIRSLEVIDGE